MLEFAGQTDVGRRRQLNEDHVFLEQDLFLVCDGMGGHRAGEVASRLAAEVIAGFVERSARDQEITWPYGFDPKLTYDANRLRTAIKLANRMVFRKAASADDYTGMGTTVAAVIGTRREPRITYAHVGDSRVYLIRAGAIIQLTRDDSLAALLSGGDPAAEPAGSTVKNILTKALGARDDVEFDVVDRMLEDGDHVLICSDGLTGMLSDARILEVVTAHGRDLGACCAELVSRANAEGGRDNISVVLLRHRLR
ncbi:MAG TPA: protein phosphatase 2C domain-containing protein [Candidatus Binatia bacterium]|nr:protein phosphatase 2C domain-containing protein [Candidatus Binatia bacterium]